MIYVSAVMASPTGPTTLRFDDRGVHPIETGIVFADTRPTLESAMDLADELAAEGYKEIEVST